MLGDSAIELAKASLKSRPNGMLNAEPLEAGLQRW
jgi:hypothetical protein